MARLLRSSTKSSSLARRSYTTHSHLPEEHRMIYEMCRKFADEELAPNAGEWDKKHEFPKEAIAHLVGVCLRLAVVGVADGQGHPIMYLISV